MRETIDEKRRRLKKICGRLRRAYPDAHCELNFSNPLELLIATILSARCTDKQVNVVTADLFRKRRGAEHYAHADRADLENDLTRLGLFRNKAKNIQAACRQLLERFGGAVPKTMAELTQLEGVGRKTANVILGTAFGINEGIVVDTHVIRLSQRLGLTRHPAPEKIERDLQPLAPRADWVMLSHWLIWHGRRRCFARNPDCANCEIQDWCPSAFRIAEKERESATRSRRRSNSV